MEREALLVIASAAGIYLIASGLKGIFQHGGKSRTDTNQTNTKRKGFNLQEIKEKLEKKEEVTLSMSEIARHSWLRFERRTGRKPEHVPEKSCFVEDVSSEASGNRILALMTANRCREEFESLSPVVKDFFFKEISPHLSKLIQNKTLKPLIKLLAILSHKGNISSVAGPLTPDRDPSYALLKHVSLLEHSFNVTRIGMKMLRNEFPFFYRLTPDKYLFIFLGHDIGKTVERAHYSTGDHPIFSAQIMEEIIPDEIPWKTSVLKAVKNHHTHSFEKEPDPASDDFDVWLLQKADRKARESEILSISKQFPIEETKPTSQATVPQIPEPSPELEAEQVEKADEYQKHPGEVGQTQREEMKQEETIQEEPTVVGITPSDILGKIEPLVNHVVTGEDMKNPEMPVPPETAEGNFVAFSQPDGIVYLRPDTIYQAFLIVVGQKGLQGENASLLSLPKPIALRHLVGWLMKNNCIPSGHVKQGYIGRYYSFEYAGRTHNALLTPILAQAFGRLPGDFEAIRLKTPKVSKITNVKKAMKK